MGCRIDIVLTGMKTTLIPLYISIRALGWPSSCQWTVIFWKECFFWVVVLNSGLKIFSKLCCKQMCGHPGFVVPFIEHRQSRVSIILKGHRIFRMVNKHWLQLQVTGCISPLQESQPILWSLKPDIGFSSLAMEALDGPFFQYKAVSSTLKIYCLV